MQSKQILFIALLSILISVVTSVVVIGQIAPKTTDSETDINRQLQDIRADLAAKTDFSLTLERQIQTLQQARTQTNQADPRSGSGFTEQLDEARVTLNANQQTNDLSPQIASDAVDNYRKLNLLKNGFAEEEANWVLETEAQVQLESLYDQYRARRKQAELKQDSASSGTDNNTKTRFELLREKLGDDYYERYLKANGFPTSVNVSSILEGSPGANAGLQRGDRILSYNGSRVFNIRELNGLTMQGDEGQSVLIEVERNGNPVQITLPRGPIGIIGGRRRF